MRSSADLARQYGVHLHTHVAETTRRRGVLHRDVRPTPVELMEDLGWVGDDVWYAHGVYINDDEILRLAASETGVAHCPSSNMRLASGIAPVRRYLAAGVRLGLGVDGSASNDGSHIDRRSPSGDAARPACSGTVDRRWPSADRPEALRIATRGSAAVLGRDDVGSLEPGKAADFIAISLDRLEYAGALHDPVAAVLFVAPTGVDESYVQGRPVVRGRELVGVDLPKLIARHNMRRPRGW